MKIQLSAASDGKQSRLVFAAKKSKWQDSGLSKKEADYVEKRIKADERFIVVNQLDRLVMIQLIPSEEKNRHKMLEVYRKAGHIAAGLLNKHMFDRVEISDNSKDASFILAAAEGMALSSYQFLKYKSAEDRKKKKHTLEKISISHKGVKKEDCRRLEILVESVYKARDLVNEPQSYLDAEQFAEEFLKMGKEAAFKVEVLNKSKIEALKMGGLLAVNKGSNTPPTFTIMEYKPKKAVNARPYVMVGKGVVYDTGGLSLKPTLNSMDYMKCDMAGGAVVACSLYAIARMQLPLHVIALVPATDNRPGEDAYTPGDVITMYSGLTVEVLNTDAEGRMILADALAYAKKYKPELVVDFATLTGAAAVAIGPQGIVCMGNAGEKVKDQLKEAGNTVHERLVEFPFWDDYKDLIKSDVAEIKNIGGSVAGAITAGKFLEYFTDYPYMHFDIAGPAFLQSGDTYRGKGGTGVGVRLMVEFFKSLLK